METILNLLTVYLLIRTIHCFPLIFVPGYIVLFSSQTFQRLVQFLWTYQRLPVLISDSVFKWRSNIICFSMHPSDALPVLVEFEIFQKDQTVHFVWDSRNGTTSNPSSRGLHWRSLHQRIKFVAQQTQLWTHSLPAPQGHDSSSLSNIYQPLIQRQALC